MKNGVTSKQAARKLPRLGVVLDKKFGHNMESRSSRTAGGLSEELLRLFESVGAVFLSS